MKKVTNLSKSIVNALSKSLAKVRGLVSNNTTNQMVYPGEDISKTIAQSKVSLEEALQIARGSAKGELVEVKFNQNNRIVIIGKYEMSLVSSDNKTDIEIDAHTGEIIQTKQTSLDNEALDEHSTVKQAEVSMMDAMHKAAQTMDGHIIEAKFDREKAMYEIGIAQDGQVHHVAIDAVTGEVCESHVNLKEEKEEQQEVKSGEFIQASRAG